MLSPIMALRTFLCFFLRRLRSLSRKRLCFCLRLRFCRRRRLRRSRLCALVILLRFLDLPWLQNSAVWELQPGKVWPSLLLLGLIQSGNSVVVLIVVVVVVVVVVVGVVDGAFVVVVVVLLAVESVV